ncbi:helix-turn-helix transcriptional regulator [Egicoccus sp. AB-alg6-2]|uniref:helix-turn-helix transcriptional regulator n=1 Tax=Egicoccus sp. AB-alg6-2 TaxID=3242692 RepID=UPI00359D1119
MFAHEVQSGTERRGVQRRNGVSPGRLIREARFARGWTQEQAAEIAGVSVGAWRSTESGRRRPRPQTFAAILSALDLALEDVRAAGPLVGEVEQARNELSRLCDELAPEHVEPVLHLVRLLTEQSQRND